MKVHLKQIPAEGTHLKGKEKTDILELEDDQVRTLGNRGILGRYWNIRLQPVRYGKSRHRCRTGMCQLS